ncbi:MAG: SPOR domain-containing protein [Sulfurimonas sp.]|nr:SPOR domain-containing protein [Sulfurimonas sp.]
MEEKNELNDIILNKGNSTSSNKKILLAVATLGVVLIIVIMLMNTLNSNSGDNLPKPVPLPATQAVDLQISDEEEPLFEDVEVIQEETIDSNNLEQIAQKLKEESSAESIKAPVKKVEVKKTEVKKTETKKVEKTEIKKVEKTEIKKTDSYGSYYIQVGSFSKYKPNKKFLKSITDKGYAYKFHKVGSLNKVLVGPFSNNKKARTALRAIRSSIEAGAFVIKI